MEELRNELQDLKDERQELENHLDSLEDLLEDINQTPRNNNILPILTTTFLEYSHRVHIRCVQDEDDSENIMDAIETVKDEIDEISLEIEELERRILFIHQ